MQTIIEWFRQSDPVELTGIVLSLIYLYFEIKAKVIMWFFGIVSSALLAWVFFHAGFYADSGLMIYYIIISIYGWIHWNHKPTAQALPITNINRQQIRTSLLILVGCYALLLTILLKMPAIIGLKDSSFPFTDAFTVAASVVATWLLSQKVIQQWHIWLVVNIISAIMFSLKELHYTMFLYIVYTIGSVIGLVQWHKNLKAQKTPLC